VVLHNSSEGDCAPKIPSRHPMHVELPKTLFMVPHVCFVCDRGEFKHGRGGREREERAGGGREGRRERGGKW
jgi:hypothetical protein